MDAELQKLAASGHGRSLRRVREATEAVAKLKAYVTRRVAALYNL